MVYQVLSCQIVAVEILSLLKMFESQLRFCAFQYQSFCDLYQIYL